MPAKPRPATLSVHQHGGIEMRKIILLLAAAFALAGCVSKYKPIATEAPASILSSGASFYVMQPADGRYGSHSYPDSGEQTAVAVQSALIPRAGRVIRAQRPEELETALSTAREKNLDYVLQTRILNWEDRATEWSGIPDKLSLNFEIYDAATGERVASQTSKASSKWATFGGDHPQDLLPLPIGEFMKTVFGS
ncbi:DUF4823 domain-containing protein [Parvibaculum sp.]|uniref:DUF4823 domain-containing protein n=1 Tax=Parvibaculum sp. TaxID=2024848 RepID=UPI002732A065|nr:DUF4823 domain-containing protein [Parvibaculum sp.]MDP3329973.1 DUF4823 domain-containing protein [Parvibaculum sp.]